MKDYKRVLTSTLCLGILFLGSGCGHKDSPLKTTPDQIQPEILTPFPLGKSIHFSEFEFQVKSVEYAKTFKISAPESQLLTTENYFLVMTLGVKNLAPTANRLQGLNKGWVLTDSENRIYDCLEQNLNQWEPSNKRAYLSHSTTLVDTCGDAVNGKYPQKKWALAAMNPGVQKSMTLVFEVPQKAAYTLQNKGAAK